MTERAGPGIHAGAGPFSCNHILLPLEDPAVILRERTHATGITTRTCARPKDLCRVARGTAIGSRSSPSVRQARSFGRRQGAICKHVTERRLPQEVTTWFFAILCKGSDDLSCREMHGRPPRVTDGWRKSECNSVFNSFYSNILRRMSKSRARFCLMLSTKRRSPRPLKSENSRVVPSRAFRRSIDPCAADVQHRIFPSPARHRA